MTTNIKKQSQECPLKFIGTIIKKVETKNESCTYYMYLKTYLKTFIEESFTFRGGKIILWCKNMTEMTKYQPKNLFISHWIATCGGKNTMTTDMVLCHYLYPFWNTSSFAHRFCTVSAMSTPHERQIEFWNIYENILILQSQETILGTWKDPPVTD